MLSVRHSFSVSGFVAIAWGFALFLAACSSREERALDIPEGLAAVTLKEFARQTNVEILFDLQIVYGVKTKAVKGDYEPDSALRIMLKDTSLGVDFENESGAFAIYRKEF